MVFHGAGFSCEATGIEGRSWAVAIVGGDGLWVGWRSRGVPPAMGGGHPVSGGNSRGIMMSTLTKLAVASGGGKYGGSELEGGAGANSDAI